MANDGARSYLVDTNVLSRSEALGADAPVARWIRTHAAHIRISVITVAEMRRGLTLRADAVARLADARARRREQAKLDLKAAWYAALRDRFGDRLDGIDADVAERWADVSIRFPSLRDGDKVILATALVRGYTIATRNLGDFRASGIDLVDLFDPETWAIEPG